MVARYVLERWLPIPGYEGYYEVSNLGRVRGLDRLILRNGKYQLKKGIVLRQSFSADGYLKVALTKNKVREDYSAHQLVCLVFHGPKPSPKHEVAHKDGTRTNNRWDNVRWSTKVENYADMVKHGTSPRGNNNKRSSITEADVPEIRILLERGISCAEIGRKFNTSRDVISNIKHKRYWTWL